MSAGGTPNRSADTEGLPTTRTVPVPVSNSRVLRAVEACAGLLGGGLALAGVVLLLLQLLAPAVIDDAVGPGWGVVAAHLLVGAAAESARALRRRLPVPARALVAGVTVLAVLAVLLLCWWR